MTIAPSTQLGVNAAGPPNDLMTSINQHRRSQDFHYRGRGREVHLQGWCYFKAWHSKGFGNGISPPGNFRVLWSGNGISSTVFNALRATAATSVPKLSKFAPVVSGRPSKDISERTTVLQKHCETENSL